MSQWHYQRNGFCFVMKSHYSSQATHPSFISSRILCLLFCASLLLELKPIFKFLYKSNFCDNPKSLNTCKTCCHHPKLWLMWFNQRTVRLKDADRWATSVLPRSDCSWVYTVLPDLFVRRLWIIKAYLDMVNRFYWKSSHRQSFEMQRSKFMLGYTWPVCSFDL